MAFEWVMYKGESNSFPYRLVIRENERIILDLRVKEKWPGSKGNIFCLRHNPEVFEEFTEIERVSILSLNRYGKKLLVVLDRLLNKRCEFLFLKKKYKNQAGEYEQIFWRTQAGLKERGRNFKIYVSNKAKTLKILIDKNEKYAWNFKCETKRVDLPTGDYALETEKGVIAVIERKTLDNFISEAGNFQVLIQKTAELAKYKYAAFVIEANYSDFLKKREHYSPAFFSKIIGNFQALFPSLPVVFAGSRKYAENWAINYFQFVAQLETENELFTDLSEEKKNTRMDISIEDKIMSSPFETFSLDEIKNYLPAYSKVVLRNRIKNLEESGKLIKHRKGNRLYWTKVN